MKFVSAFRKFCSALVPAVILAGSYPAHASVYFEIGDAGTTAETASYIPWDTATIFGTIHENDGADVYGFEWAGGLFLANTEGSDFDTMLSLFNESGSLLQFNDDFGSMFSQLSMELDPGNYFLGVTYYSNNYLGDMRYYLEEGMEGSYQIQKTVAAPVPPQPPITANVPEPASFALVGIGLAGLIFHRRRKTVL